MNRFKLSRRPFSHNFAVIPLSGPLLRLFISIYYRNRHNIDLLFVKYSHFIYQSLILLKFLILLQKFGMTLCLTSVPDQLAFLSDKKYTSTLLYRNNPSHVYGFLYSRQDVISRLLFKK